MKTFIFIFLLSLCGPFVTHAQNVEWTIFLPGNIISDVNEANDYLWLASENKVFKFEKATGAFVAHELDPLIDSNIVVNTIETDAYGLPWIGIAFFGTFKMTEEGMWQEMEPQGDGLDKLVNSIVCANDSSVWIMAPSRLVKYYENEYTIVNTFNGFLSSIAIDKANNLWLATYNGLKPHYEGLIKYDGNSITIFSSWSSGEDPMVFNPISIDENGKKWMGGYLGMDYGRSKLVSFDNSEWEVFDLPITSAIVSIAIKEDVIWVGTKHGLLKFHESNWTILDTLNNSLLDKNIYSIVADDDGSIWLGTESGLIKLNETNIATSLVDVTEPEVPVLIYPNPSEGEFYLKNSLKTYVNLTVYDICGRVIDWKPDIKPSEKENFGFKYSPGIYVAVIDGDNYTESKRLIKK